MVSSWCKAWEWVKLVLVAIAAAVVPVAGWAFERRRRKAAELAAQVSRDALAAANEAKRRRDVALAEQDRMLSEIRDMEAAAGREYDAKREAIVVSPTAADAWNKAHERE